MSNTLRMSNTLPRTSLRGSYSAERCHLCRTVGISTSKAGVFQISPHTIRHATSGPRGPGAVSSGRFRFVASEYVTFRYARATPFTRHVAVHQGGKGAPELLGRSATVRRVASWLVAPRLDRLETPGAPALGPAFDRIANRHASPGAILHATRSLGPSCMQREPRAILHTTRALGYPACTRPTAGCLDASPWPLMMTDCLTHHVPRRLVLTTRPPER